MYDQLITAIPYDLTADEIIVGTMRTFVKSRLGAGIAITGSSDSRPYMEVKSLIGKPLVEIAKLSKSWNLIEASIGMAAMNAYYNTIEIAESNGITLSKKLKTEDRKNDPYIVYQNLVRNKKVATVGHTRYLYELINKTCELTLIGDQKPGYYPESAVEFLLPYQDYIFLTSTAFTSKKIVRWLELSKNSKVIVYGPTLPMSPLLFQYGIYDMSGFIVYDIEHAKYIISGAENTSFYSTGEKVSLKADMGTCTC